MIFRWKSRHVDFLLKNRARQFLVQKAIMSIFSWKNGLLNLFITHIHVIEF